MTKQQQKPQAKQGEATRSHSSRKLRNFLLMPRIQVALGAYMLALASCLLVSLCLIIYYKMADIVAIIVQLTDIEEEVQEVLFGYVNGMAIWLGGAVVLYIIANLILSIMYTHKMVGPSYAFRRHIRHLIKGDYQHRIKLRKGDAFTEMADELNLLAQTLEEKTRHKDR